MVACGAVMRWLFRVCSIRKCLFGLVCISGLYLLSTSFSNSFTSTRISYQEGDASSPSRKQSMETLSHHVVPSLNAQEKFNEKVEHDGGQQEGHHSEIVGFDFHGDGRNVLHSVSRRVLLLYDPVHLDVARKIQALLISHRVSHDLHTYSSNPTTFDLQILDRSRRVGRYCLIICAGLYSNLQRYRDYSNIFNVTIVSFVSAPVDVDKHSMEMGLVAVKEVAHSNVTGVMVNPNKDYYYLKTGEWITDFYDNYRWWTFDSSNFPVDVLASIRHQDGILTTPLVLLSRSRSGRGTEVLFGSTMEFWLSQLLLLEVLRSHPAIPILRFGRTRWTMIDIDDIFVAPESLKMSVDDVQALISTQETLREYAPGLTFNLGFCGQYYTVGQEWERNGSASLVQNRDKFWWFGHIYNHFQPHLLSEEKLRAYIQLNLDFAKNHSINPTENSYSVSPHHSGVYPIHAPLYNAWRQLLNVSMTTTEEYPHLYPSYKRRGYIYQGLMVVPRQTCRLFTHNILFENFVVKKAGEEVGVVSKGKEGLRGVAQGGEVFTTLLYNPVSIFMTHVTNYGHDRLAPFLFRNLFQFVSRWTKLNLTTARPLHLGKTYFSIFPEEKEPVWTSPCNDKRHLDIWAAGQDCSRLPEVLILGPQKTGSTALQFFLKTHPNLTTSFPSKETYEEVQFFSNNRLYMKGIEWYMSRFPYPNTTKKHIFEKSATYFTHQAAPARVFSLLPKAKLIIILHDPVRRAYSWYQHMRAHNDKTAMAYSFMEVLTGNLSHAHNHTSWGSVRQLREHCLSPGHYEEHVARWLRKFRPTALHFVDGEVLQQDPARVLGQLQRFLQVPVVDYHNTLRFSQRKGQYCIVEGREHCLGPSKGRGYAAMGQQERTILEQYYSTHNIKLAKLLQTHNRPLPSWLTRALERPRP